MAAIPGQQYPGSHDNTPAKDNGQELIPVEIATNPERLAIWNFLVADLRNRNLWSPTYSFTVACMVMCASRLNEITKVLDTDGVTEVKTSAKGAEIGKMKHHLLSEEGNLRKELLKHIEKLGMSPRDIVFLTQTESVVDGRVNVLVPEEQKIVYFRDE